jgi:hypothetical protein
VFFLWWHYSESLCRAVFSFPLHSLQFFLFLHRSQQYMWSVNDIMYTYLAYGTACCTCFTLCDGK